MEIIIYVLVSMVCGIIAANAFAFVARNLSLSFFGNSIIGLWGGALGGQLFTWLIESNRLPSVNVFLENIMSSDYHNLMLMTIGGIMGGMSVFLLLRLVHKLFERGGVNTSAP